MKIHDFDPSIQEQVSICKRKETRQKVLVVLILFLTALLTSVALTYGTAALSYGERSLMETIIIGAFFYIFISLFIVAVRITVLRKQIKDFIKKGINPDKETEGVVYRVTRESNYMKRKKGISIGGFNIGFDDDVVPRARNNDEWGRIKIYKYTIITNEVNNFLYMRQVSGSKQFETGEKVLVRFNSQKPKYCEISTIHKDEPVGNKNTSTVESEPRLTISASSAQGFNKKKERK